VTDADDWRVSMASPTMHGLVLRWARWRPSNSVTFAPTGEVTPSTWDHDHCELCFQEFCDEEHASGDGRQSLTEGYAARGPAGSAVEQQRADYHWICPACFADLKEHFGWTVRSDP